MPPTINTMVGTRFIITNLHGATVNSVVINTFFKYFLVSVVVAFQIRRFNKMSNRMILRSKDHKLKIVTLARIVPTYMCR